MLLCLYSLWVLMGKVKQSNCKQGVTLPPSAHGEQERVCVCFGGGGVNASCTLK